MFREMCRAFQDAGVLKRPADISFPVSVGYDFGVVSTRLRNTPPLPAPYFTSFEQPLRTNLSDVLDKLRNARLIELHESDDLEQRAFIAADFKAILLGCLTDREPAAGPLRQLTTLQRSADSIFSTAINRFRSAAIGSRTSISLLANFSSSPWIGPQTKNIDRVNQFFALKPEVAIAGITGMPAAYKNSPLLWAVLAHEICGHGVMHVLDTPNGDTIRAKNSDHAAVIQELRGEIWKTNFPEHWKDIWVTWMEEMVADVCALLTMGPASILSLAAWISASDRANADDYAVVSLGTLHSSVWTVDGDVREEHPPLLLRLYLCLGVLNYLRETWLQPGPRSTSIDEGIDIINSVIAQNPEKSDTIDFVDAVDDCVVLSFNRTTISNWTKDVGRLIAATPLVELNGKCLAEILLYSDDDALAVEGVRTANGASVIGRETANHLLAGATLALWDRPEAYAMISHNLNTALAGLP